MIVSVLEELIDIVDGKFQVERIEILQEVSDKFIEFVEFTGNYVKAQGGWWHKFSPQTTENLKTTEELWNFFIDNYDAFKTTIQAG